SCSWHQTMKGHVEVRYGHRIGPPRRGPLHGSRPDRAAPRPRRVARCGNKKLAESVRLTAPASPPTTPLRRNSMNDRAPTNPEFNSLLPKVKFSRRGFIASSVATGFAVSAGPLMAQTMIKTPMDGLAGGDIKIPRTGGEMPGYYAAPKKPGKFPVILVVGEVWGVHEHIKDICRRLAKAGYFAVANEPYWQIGELWKLE